VPEPLIPRTVDEHVAKLTSERVVNSIAQRTGGNLDRIAATLNTYVAEFRYGLHLIAPQLPRRGRILEVGAGVGILSSYLRLLGHDITALEPCAQGFNLFTEMQAALLEEIETDLPILQIGAEGLSPAQHGAFQFIFSVNVLEHVSDLAGAMRGMASVLVSGGRMWHTCPNYVVPYEPHFGLPLIPFYPEATNLFLPRRISDDKLWRSLNFITYFQIKRLARANGLSTSFLPGAMSEALKRLDSDAAFAGRQKGVASDIHRVLKAMGGVGAIKVFPAWASTPMMVTIENKE
jgi:2-polyprenyl-3-methyl-5-hydroxy-6-metoxy-1,4-benzoquinol methylase